QKHKNHPRYRGRGRAKILKNFCCRAGFIIAKISNKTAVCRNRANHFVMKFRRLAGMARRICFISFNKCCSKMSPPKTTTPTSSPTHMPSTATTSESSSEISLSGSKEELYNSIDIVMGGIAELEFSEDEL
ncbi:unnamed protein product, partial [Owenia fusiformis]